MNDDAALLLASATGEDLRLACEILGLAALCGWDLFVKLVVNSLGQGLTWPPASKLPKLVVGPVAINANSDSVRNL